MSVAMSRKVWKTAQVSGRPLIVLLAAADKADAKGEAIMHRDEWRRLCRLNLEQFTGALETLTTTKHLQLSNIEVDGRVKVTLFPGRGWAVQRP